MNIKTQTEKLAAIIKDEAPADWMLGFQDADCFPHPFHMVLEFSSVDGVVSFRILPAAFQCPVFLGEELGYGVLLFTTKMVAEATDEQLLELARTAIEGVQDAVVKYQAKDEDDGS